MNPNLKTWSFDVVHHGERSAGILAYSDTIRISVESGDPGGIEGEFEQYIRQCLAQWYDGARVELSN
jgi:hypothetical protein